MISRGRAILLASLLVLGSSLDTSAAELKVLASRAIWTVLAVVAPEFEQSTGHKLTVETGLSSEFIRRIRAGEKFDVIAAPPSALDSLVKDGAVIATSKSDCARSAYGVVIRKGAPRPDIGTVEAFIRALRDAKSITYLPVPGVPQLIERLGLKDAIASKVTIPSTDISTELVAKGEVELAIVAITQAYTTPGVELAGTLPSEIQLYTSFGAAIATRSEAVDAARALITFLKSPTAVRVIKEQGMEPI